ncbi:pyrroline-5-carboxylate reductase [Archaeoglobales archaeon]|nr:MAG: pyrroline-5-carboxylate reductase [Archaeoglobales archaeon]
MRIAIVGYGNLGNALAKSLIKKHEIIATKRELENIKSISKKIEVTTDNVYAVKNSDCVILTVKSKGLKTVLDEVKDNVKDKTVISFVAFVRLDEIKEQLKQAKVVRAMGNVCAEIGKSFTVYYTEDDVDDKVIDLFSLMGRVYKAKSEEELDLMTVFSGSAPAFVAKLINAFVFAGLKCGLNAELSKEVALSIFESTSKILENMKIEDLTKRITTPAGTTIEGLVTMEKYGVEFGIVDSITKAVEKISKFKKG